MPNCSTTCNQSCGDKSNHPRIGGAVFDTAPRLPGFNQRPVQSSNCRYSGSDMNAQPRFEARRDDVFSRTFFRFGSNSTGASQRSRHAQFERLSIILLDGPGNPRQSLMAPAIVNPATLASLIPRPDFGHKRPSNRSSFGIQTQRPASHSMPCQRCSLRTFSTTPLCLRVRVY